MHRSVLVLLNFSKAYNNIWREKLLLRMLDMGIPITIIRWLRSFLNDRRAKVQPFNILSNSRRFKQGLPQGSVLSPLLFLFYISDLADKLSDEDVIALFADDASILSTARNKADAERSVQAKVDIVSRWRQQWKLQLNVGKSGVSYQHSLLVRMTENGNQRNQGRNIPFNSTPCLLGVLLDGSLTFNADIDKVYADTASRLRGMKLVSHSTWGWKKSTMKTMHFAYVRTKMDYAAPAWQPWLSNTNMTRLEALQNRALRIVTGHLVSTPLDALRKEANVNSYSTTSKQLILKAREKALRNTDDHPKRIALNAHVPQRLQSRSNWRRKAIELAVALPETLNHRQQTNQFTVAPWVVDDCNNCTIHRSIPDISSRADSIDLKSQMSISHIDNFGADYIIYTDGSARAGSTNGGSAVVVTQGPAQHSVTIATIKNRGCHFTSSFDEELAALTHALQWVIDQHLSNTTILICTDSKSLCDALAGRNVRVDDIHLLLHAVPATIIIQWIPGHSNILGNELADTAAKQATGRPSTADLPITLSSAVKVVRDSIQDAAITHDRTKEIYNHYRPSIDAEQITKRADEVLLTKLRAGHHPALQAYLHCLDPDVDPTCPSCNKDQHTLQHWLIHAPLVSECFRAGHVLFTCGVIIPVLFGVSNYGF